MKYVATMQHKAAICIIVAVIWCDNYIAAQNKLRLYW